LREKVTVDIEKIVYGGQGLGRAGGKVVFIPFSAPGDRVTSTILREKKNYFEGRIQTIERASSKRIPPFCEFFGRCGGCQLQHLDYADQISVKDEILRDSFRRISPKEPFEILPMIPSPRERAYRLRVQFKAGQSEGKNNLGFLELKSHRIVEIDQCPLLHPLANKILRELDAELGRMPGYLALKEAEIFISPDEDKGGVHLTGEGLKSFEFSEKYFQKSGLIKGIRLKGSRGVSWGDLGLRFRLPGLVPERPIQVRIQTGSFFQVNPWQNENLIRKIGGWASLSGIERVLDLFCGAGNITLPLAQKAGKIWGIDSDEKAIAPAKQNAEENGLKNVIFQTQKAEAGITKVLGESEPIDVAVLDPPRAGAREALMSLAAIGPRKILYVSCEPPTLIRDLVLLGELGYNITRVQPLDMFPQTYHLEVIAELRKAS